MAPTGLWSNSYACPRGILEGRSVIEMNEFNFKQCFTAALPPPLLELDLRLNEFVDVDPATLGSLAQRERDFLLQQGLPCEATRFFHLRAYPASEINDRVAIFGLPPSAFPIGSNGWGDMVAIDEETGNIVLFHGESDNRRVFFNATLLQFAQCLCAYQEHSTHMRRTSFLDAIACIDPAAAAPGTMWFEIDMQEYEEQMKPELVDLCDNVQDQHTFMVFAKALLSDRYEAMEKEALGSDSPDGDDESDWENRSIDRFLEAALAWAEDSDMGLSQGASPANPWGRFASFLYCGKIYE